MSVSNCQMATYLTCAAGVAIVLSHGGAAALDLLWQYPVPSVLLTVGGGILLGAHKYLHRNPAIASGRDGAQAAVAAGTGMLAATVTELDDAELAVVAAAMLAAADEKALVGGQSPATAAASPNVDPDDNSEPSSSSSSSSSSVTASLKLDYPQLHRARLAMLKQEYDNRSLSKLPTNISIGSGHGIQNGGNSCAIASLLYGLFMTTDIFDDILLIEQPRDNQDVKTIKGLLRAIVNDLRKNQFVSSDKLVQLRSLVMQDTTPSISSKSSSSHGHYVTESDEEDFDSDDDFSVDSVGEEFYASEDEFERFGTYSPILGAGDFWQALMKKLNPEYNEVEIMHAMQGQKSAQVTANYLSHVSTEKDSVPNTQRKAVFITTPRTDPSSSNYGIDEKIIVDGILYILQAVIGHEDKRNHEVVWTFTEKGSMYYFDSHFEVDKQDGEVWPLVQNVSDKRFAKDWGSSKMKREATFLIYIRMPQSQQKK